MAIVNLCHTISKLINEVNPPQFVLGEGLQGICAEFTLPQLLQLKLKKYVEEGGILIYNSFMDYAYERGKVANLRGIVIKRRYRRNSG